MGKAEKTTRGNDRVKNNLLLSVARNRTPE
jgi:hypothetical protein